MSYSDADTATETHIVPGRSVEHAGLKTTTFIRFKEDSTIADSFTQL